MAPLLSLGRGQEKQSEHLGLASPLIASFSADCSFWFWPSICGPRPARSRSRSPPTAMTSTTNSRLASTGPRLPPITPPASLLHLRDPYDPALNAPYQAAYHDFALYGGHFYSSWGPTPVLTLFAPFRLLTGRVVPESFAVALFCFIGLACAVALLHLLVARWVPRTPRWVLLTSTACLALCNAAPFLLRRPIEYEVAISCGYCFEMAGLLLVAASLREQRVSRGDCGREPVSRTRGGWPADSDLRRCRRTCYCAVGDPAAR